ncbi:BCL2/adenovirus E1B 19kD-interacting protein 1 [Sarcoptes scabiei]|nr:BCL2/adenovirus E1B 19kD-interacting protein 1 [Sarcoptes scabiei]
MPTIVHKYLNQKRVLWRLEMLEFALSILIGMGCHIQIGSSQKILPHRSVDMMTGMGDVDSFNPMLLPKRLASSIDAKMNLHLSDNEIEHAFSLGKDMAIRNWRLEDQLVRDGLTTNMSKISAVSRHQAVTTTLPLGNLLDHSQQVFEETSKILLRK